MFWGLSGIVKNQCHLRILSVHVDSGTRGGAVG